jgi:hypothetical protein
VSFCPCRPDVNCAAHAHDAALEQRYGVLLESLGGDPADEPPFIS